MCKLKRISQVDAEYGEQTDSNWYDISWLTFESKDKILDDIPPATPSASETRSIPDDAFFTPLSLHHATLCNTSYCTSITTPSASTGPCHPVDLEDFPYNGSTVKGKIVKKSLRSNARTSIWIVSHDDRRRRKNEEIPEKDLKLLSDDYNNDEVPPTAATTSTTRRGLTRRNSQTTATSSNSDGSSEETPAESTTGGKKRRSTRGSSSEEGSKASSSKNKQGKSDDSGSSSRGSNKRKVASGEGNNNSNDNTEEAVAAEENVTAAAAPKKKTKTTATTKVTNKASLAQYGTRSTRGSGAVPMAFLDTLPMPRTVKKTTATKKGGPTKKIKKNENVQVVKMLTGTLYLYRGERPRAEFVRSKY
ncbi:predicted protein [Thalassiosira pseudonana CCMP1335]|uniref:Uncharacterized protein n=1 Tax=Thalassiosira pseudonana TaxID=35128 RepID=B8LBL7_THAPS|nr:predicted protein [Thalassiosira pseudonana CCMP1335]EED87070.1 predicted protein [Thalassiosira pseudonana CCMP1335]